MKYCFLCGIIFSFAVGYFYGQMENVSVHQLLKQVDFSIESMQEKIAAHDEQVIKETLEQLRKQ